MIAPDFDLQSHSTHSDGELSPAAVVDAAAAAGVRLLALTDHDSLDGFDEAHAAAARHPQLRLLSAVEISVRDPAAADLHLCGYLVDPTDAPLRALLARSREDRSQRAGRMVQALERLGFTVDREALAARAAAGQPVGRPHIAAATVAIAANRDRLAAAGLLDASAFLEAYLIPGRPAFCERDAPTMATAIASIHAAGGVAVWAHPFWDFASDDDVLDALARFAPLGLDGVETFYITHSRAQTELLAWHCQQHDLLSTGSSDFHGPRHRLFHSFRAFATYGLTPRLGPLDVT